MTRAFTASALLLASCADSTPAASDASSSSTVDFEDDARPSVDGAAYHARTDTP